MKEQNSTIFSFLSWWKVLTILLLFYTVLAGFLAEVPRLNILNETIRNLYFHVPMWFAMVILLLISVVNSVRYLGNPKAKFDSYAVEAANTGVVFGILGIVTGMIWAKYTWGSYWSKDPKQNAAAIGLLIYFAYLVLRGAFNDDQLRAKVSAIYNILAYPTFVAFIFIIPRMSKDSLHPGNGGNPGFNAYDLDAGMRMVFYPAVLAFTLLGWWITTLRVRTTKIYNHITGIESFKNNLPPEALEYKVEGKRKKVL